MDNGDCISEDDVTSENIPQNPKKWLLSVNVGIPS